MVAAFASRAPPRSAFGAFTVPVYEIYKVGQPPHWLEGLDLLGRIGLSQVAVIPHFDNSEGGTHDARYCYLGERRLEEMERQLPDGALVLGIDEHTALVLDVAAGCATISGLGALTVRTRGRSTRFASGSVVRLSELLATVSGGGEDGPPAASPARRLAAEPA